MRKFDILIVGGGPAGLVAALQSKRLFPDKKVALVRKEKRALIPCAIPYLPKRLGSVEKDLIPDQPLKSSQIDLVIDKVVGLDLTAKEVLLKSKEKLGWDRLILAVGSHSRSLPIEGQELRGVYQIHKGAEYLERFRKAVAKAGKIVIIGGGFIGLELADEISRMAGKEIAVVEFLGHCLATNFDQKFSQMAEERMKKAGVRIYTNEKAQKIEGQERAEAVKLASGQSLPADLVVMAVGTQPNIRLAKEAGIKADEKLGIWVDSYQKTEAKDVFAVGDCALTRDIVTGRPQPVLLASTACAEARVAANNLYVPEDKLVEHQGTVGAFNTRLNGLVLGAAGLTEGRARAEKIDYIVGQAQSPSCHPGTLVDREKMIVKMLFSSKNLKLIGGQVAGPLSVAEIPYLFSIAIEKKMTAQQLAMSQPATHPLLTSPPTSHPIIVAAQSAVLGQGRKRG